MNSPLEMDLAFFFKKMQQLYLPEEAQDVYGTIKMAIDTGSRVEEWFVHLSPQECRVTSDPSDAYNVKLSMSKDTFVKTFLGMMPMEEAYNEHLVIVEGDVDFAAFLIICFPRTYRYDAWLYSLERRLIQHQAKGKAAVYKLAIQNTPSQLPDEDLGESLTLAPAEEQTHRFVMVHDGHCEVLPFNAKKTEQPIEIPLKDADLLALAAGHIDFGELIRRSTDQNPGVATEMATFKELFAL